MLDVNTEAQLRINFNMSFPNLQCDFAVVDVLVRKLATHDDERLIVYMSVINNVFACVGSLNSGCPWNQPWKCYQKYNEMES